MIPLDLATIAGIVQGRLIGPADAPTRVVASVSTDTRVDELVRALFVALVTPTGDGHDHLVAALERGAVAALVSDAAAPMAPPSAELLPRIVVDDGWRALRALAVDVRQRVAPSVVAITGSYGKTTTKDLALGAIGAARRTVASRGSYNNELGVPLTMLDLELDSEALVAEVGARHVGDIAAMAALLGPDVAVVTAVAGVHLEVFGSIDDVARGKRELVESLGPKGTAVLNADDPRVLAMAEVAPAVLTYAVGSPADVMARGIRLDDGARAIVDVTSPWGPIEVRVPLAGRHHVGNALAALAAAGLLDVPMQVAAEGIERSAVSPWRCEVTRSGGVTLLNDAYNASPDTVRAALDLLMELPVTGQRVAVLGAMAELGAGSAVAHREIGRAVAERGIDVLVVVGRGDGDELAAGAREGGLAAGAVRPVDGVEDAARLLAGTVGPGDAVLVKASRVVGLERLVDLLGDVVASSGAAVP